MPKRPQPAIAVALSTAAALFTANPSQTAAQNKALQEESYPLSAAIEEAKQSPFHARSEASALLFTPTRIGFSSPTRIGVSSPVWLTPSPTGDDTPSVGKVFLASWVSTTASDLAGLYLLGQAYRADSFGAGLAVLAAAPVAVMGGAVGAKLVGAPFGRAAMGSLTGAALGFVVFALAGPRENYLSSMFLTAVHAGAVTIGAVG